MTILSSIHDGWFVLGPRHAADPPSKVEKAEQVWRNSPISFYLVSAHIQSHDDYHDDGDWWSVHIFKVKMNFHDHDDDYDDNAQEGATRIHQTAKSVFGPGHAAK